MAIALGLCLLATTRRRRWLASVAFLLGLFLLGCWWDLRAPGTRVAWIAVIGFLGLLLAIESAFWSEVRVRGGRLAWLEYGLGLLLLAGAGGVILAALAQVEAQFAEEELTALVQIAFLAL